MITCIIYYDHFRGMLLNGLGKVIPFASFVLIFKHNCTILVYIHNSQKNLCLLLISESHQAYTVSYDIVVMTSLIAWYKRFAYVWQDFCDNV